METLLEPHTHADEPRPKIESHGSYAFAVLLVPVVVKEAMAAGLPVVSTAVAGVPEMVIDGETGRLVPPEDPGALAVALSTAAPLAGAANAAAMQPTPNQYGYGYHHIDDRTDNARYGNDMRLYRDRYLEQEAGKLGLTRAQLQQFWVETNNIATERQMGQFILGLMIPIFLIIMVAVGSMHPAIDCTAGEREKSTWETLMTVATSRVNIVAAKYLYVSTMAAVAGILRSRQSGKAGGNAKHLPVADPLSDGNDTDSAP